jgi:phosphatidate cytidylyltransferase
MAENDDRYDDSLDDDGFGTIGDSRDRSADATTVARPSVWAAAAGEHLDELDDPWAPQGSGVTALGGGERLDVGPPSGPVALPDWKDPPTGQVPKVVLGDDEEGWASRTGSQPSWRGDDDWASTDFDDGLLDSGEVPVGALDSNRGEVSTAFSFEDDLPSGPQKVVQIGTDEAAVPGTATGPPVAPIRSRARPDDDQPVTPAGAAGRDLPVAIMVGGGLALLALLAFVMGDLIGPWILATVVVMGCAQELFGVFQRGGLRPATLLGLTACFSLMWGTYARGPGAIPLILVLAFVGSMLWYLMKVINARVLLGVGTTMLGIVWVGLLGSFAPLILTLPIIGKPWLLAGIVCTIVADIVALAAGSVAGHTPLAPDASPNKTWEGAFGGFVGSLVAGMVAGLMADTIGVGHGAIIGGVVGVIAPIGDLCQSLVKRDLGVKDMGTALPGHGGFLDRFDSLLFALPAVYYIAAIYG